MLANSSIGLKYNQKKCYTFAVAYLLFAHISYCIKLLYTIHICIKYFCKSENMPRQRKTIDSSNAFKKYMSYLKDSYERKDGLSHQPNDQLTHPLLPQYSNYHYSEPTKAQPISTNNLVSASQDNIPSCLSTNDVRDEYKKKRNGGYYSIEDSKRKKLKGNI